MVIPKKGEIDYEDNEQIEDKDDNEDKDPSVLTPGGMDIKASINTQPESNEISFNKSLDNQVNQGGNVDSYSYIPRHRIDFEKDKFPFCIVWTPLPLISWFIPIIGHTGICTSDGTIYDFAGSYYISRDDFAFGRPYKYVELNPDLKEQEQWDESVMKANERFTNETHNICLNNCHSHVAHMLNLLGYKNYTSYNMVSIWWMCLWNSKYVSNIHIIKTYLVFIIIFCTVLFMLKLT